MFSNAVGQHIDHFVDVLFFHNVGWAKNQVFAGRSYQNTFVVAV
jgi:hypothetical protein